MPCAEDSPAAHRRRLALSNPSIVSPETHGTALKASPNLARGLAENVTEVPVDLLNRIARAKLCVGQIADRAVRKRIAELAASGRFPEARGVVPDLLTLCQLTFSVRQLGLQRH